MQHDPGYEHWEERVPALEQAVDRHSLQIEDLENDVVRLREAVLELIRILKEKEGQNESKS